jgi:hypothetical protein
MTFQNESLLPAELPRHPAGKVSEREQKTA